MRSAAAQAIIAPLSVQSASGGASEAEPLRRGGRGERARGSRAFAATPPADRQHRRRAGMAARGRPRQARRVFSASVSATAAWKPAQRSARSARVRPPCASHQPVARAPHRGLEAGEGQVAAVAVEERPRQGEARRRRRPRAARLDRRPARLAEAEELRHLVEGLAGGVVDGAAEAAEALRPLDGEELAMPAGDQQHQVGKGHVLDQPRGQRVPGEMVDAPERQAAAGGEPLGEHHAGEHAADQPRPGGDRHRVEVAERRARRARAPPRSRGRAARRGRGRRSRAPRRRSRRAARPGPATSEARIAPTGRPGRGAHHRRRRCRRSCSRSRG